MLIALLKKLWETPSIRCGHTQSTPRLTYAMHWHPSRRVRVCQTCSYVWPAAAFDDVEVP